MESNNVKVCSKCGLSKTQAEFSRIATSSTVYSKVCKSCVDEGRSKSSERTRAYYIKRVYGITVEEYEALMKTECWICGSKTSLVLDYDPNTFGEYRGVLCSTHSTALCQFNDDKDLLKKAIAYLS